MFAIMKKELKSYLLSPIGYIFIGLFLLIFSIFFYSNIFLARTVRFEFLFADGATILTFVIPLLTMRMFSEERKNGTEQLLLTSPRSIFSIVFGKFLAAVIMVLITELLTLMYFAILKFFGKPSLEVAFATLFGFFLLSLAYISFGMFASSVTENQIVSAVVTIFIFMGIWFLPYAFEWLEIFSVMLAFEDFFYGLVSIESIIKLVSFTLVFILLTVVSLQRRKSVK